MSEFDCIEHALFTRVHELFLPQGSHGARIGILIRISAYFTVYMHRRSSVIYQWMCTLTCVYQWLTHSDDADDEFEDSDSMASDSEDLEVNVLVM